MRWAISRQEFVLVGAGQQMNELFRITQTPVRLVSSPARFV